MKRKVVDISKKMTPNETLKRIVNRVIHNNCNLMVITSGLEYDAETNNWNFEVQGYDRTDLTTWHIFSGFVGCLGQIVITKKDGVYLELDEFEEVIF